jgi:hypothetical protein
LRIKFLIASLRGVSPAARLLLQQPRKEQLREARDQLVILLLRAESAGLVIALASSRCSRRL